MSNLVHRRRRCARIVLYTRLCLDGSTPEDGSEASPRSQRISLWLQRSLFLLPTAAIFFCGFPSANRADQTDGEVQTGKLAYMTEHHYLAVRA